jgi:DNA polymerase (family X)
MLHAVRTTASLLAMNPQNRPIADSLSRIANLLELQRADPARIRAYRRASQAISALPESVRWMVRQGESLGEVASLGGSVAAAAVELAETGSCAVLQRLNEEVPQDFSELLDLPHLGPQRVRTLHEELGISTLEQLHGAAEAGRLQSLAGFGPRLERQLLKVTSANLARVRRLRLDVALPAARRLLAWIAGIAHVRRVEPAGDLRRGCDNIADLNFIAESEADREVVAAFANHPEVRDVPFAGRARIGIVLQDGLRADLHVAAPRDFGTAWLVRTGSQAHLRALARHAQRLGLTLDEGGLRSGSKQVDDGDEAAIYRHLGLAFIAPELREDRGEIEAAGKGELPQLIVQGDLRGDLHVQARAGAAETPLEDLVRAARARGLTYIAVADSARRILPSHAMPSRESDLDRLARQMAAIDESNATTSGFAVLKGVHADILEDGRLNVPDSVLRRADFVVASLGYPFDLTKTRQTERLLRAMDNRFFSILGAPTGRLIEERRPASLDLVRVLNKARERGCVVELDSRPARLDLDDSGCRAAKAAGVPVCINSCAHDADGFDALAGGVVQARRGWLEASDVLNTRPFNEVQALLARTMLR